MAQKTPLPALTVMYADRWNNTWFVDLENFRTQLMEDYHLRFLLTGFLRLKRQWLYLLSIHKSGGFYFFQVVTLNYLSSPKVKSVLQPTEKNKKKLLAMNSLVKKNKLLQSDAFDSLKRPVVPHWKRRMTYKKSRIWLTLRNKSFILKRARLSTFNITKNHNLKDILKTKSWLALHKNKIALSYYNSNLVKVYYKTNTTFNLLLNIKKKQTLLKEKELQLKGNSLRRLKQVLENKSSLDNKEQTLLKILNKLMPKTKESLNNVKTFNEKTQNKGFYAYKKNNYANKFHRNKSMPTSWTKKYFSTTETNKQNNNMNKRFLSKVVVKKTTVIKKKSLLNKQRQNLLKNLFKKKQLNHLYYYQAPKRCNKRKLAIYKTLSQFTSYLYQRMFRYKKYPTIKEGYKLLYKKYGHSLKFKKMMRRFSTSVLFICRALIRVTAMQIFLFFYPIQWAREDYKPLKKLVVFEKYGSQKHFVTSMSVLHLAMSRGSANLVIDLLVRLLRRVYLHTTFLASVEKICRYFMAPYEGSIAFKNSLCKGMEVLFKGKLNGNDRSKNWRFKFGPVHTSTFFTNTREEHAKCMTRYGVFHIRVRLKLGAIIE